MMALGMDWREHFNVARQVLDLSNSLAMAVASSERLAAQRFKIRMRVLGARPHVLDKLPVGDRGSVRYEVVGATSTSKLLVATTRHPACAGYPHMPFRVELFGDPAVAVVLGIARSRLWGEVVTRFVREAYPAMFPVFLRQQDLKRVLESLEQNLRPSEELRMTRVSRRRRQLNGDSRREYDSELAWTDKKLAEMMREAGEERLFLQRASFKVCRQLAGRPLRDTELEGDVGVNAEFAVTERPDWMFAAGLQVALDAVRGETELARDRARKPGQATARTIVAHLLDEPITQDKLKFVAARLCKMPKTSVSIIHGNPYLHARLVDFKDGSSFELLLVSPTKMLLVPQLRATEGAVTRLCRYIYEHVGEAEFLDGAAN